MHSDYVVIDFPPLPVARVEETAGRVLDSLQLLWASDHFRSLLETDVGTIAFRNFISAMTDLRSQTHRAMLDGREETSIALRLPREYGRESLAFVEALIRLCEDEQTMRSVGGRVLSADDAAFVREVLALIQRTTGL